MHERTKRKTRYVRYQVDYSHHIRTIDTTEINKKARDNDGDLMVSGRHCTAVVDLCSIECMPALGRRHDEQFVAGQAATTRKR